MTAGGGQRGNIGKGRAMKILLVGDIVGGPGRRTFREVVRKLRGEHAVQAVVVNGENAGGRERITARCPRSCSRRADVITLGDSVGPEVTGTDHRG